MSYWKKGDGQVMYLFKMFLLFPTTVICEA